MNGRKVGEGPHSPYVAFRDDKERKWALVSRDVRWVAVAIVFAFAGIPTGKWLAMWRFVAGGFG